MEASLFPVVYMLQWRQWQLSVFLWRFRIVYYHLKKRKPFFPLVIIAPLLISASCLKTNTDLPLFSAPFIMQCLIHIVDGGGGLHGSKIFCGFNSRNA